MSTLFTTLDGVQVQHDEQYYFVKNSEKRVALGRANEDRNYDDGIARFSDKQKGINFLNAIQNKPFSLNSLVDQGIIDADSDVIKTLFDALVQKSIKAHGDLTVANEDNNG